MKAAAERKEKGESYAFPYPMELCKMERAYAVPQMAKDRSVKGLMFVPAHLPYTAGLCSHKYDKILFM